MKMRPFLNINMKIYLKILIIYLFFFNNVEAHTIKSIECNNTFIIVDKIIPKISNKKIIFPSFIDLDKHDRIYYYLQKNKDYYLKK